MHLQSVLIVLLAICCLFASAQRLNCRSYRERCLACNRDRRDPIFTLPVLNRECRQRVGRRWVWTNQNVCDLQEISCRAHERKLDCEDLAELAGMQRRLP